MAQEVFLVAYDGEDRSVLDFAIKRGVKSKANLYIVHVLEWSPYSFLTPEEIEERHRSRTEELKRATEMVLVPALERARAAGLNADGEVRYGSAIDLICDIAKTKNAELIFSGRSGASGLRARIFGSVAIGLAQAAPVPIVIVP